MEFPEGWVDPAAEIDWIGQLNEPYPREFSVLVQLPQDDPVFRNFNYLVHGFLGCVFNGGGANAGLTRFCSLIAANLVDQLRKERERQIENWRSRLIFLRRVLLGLRIPKLSPVDRLLGCLHDYHSLRGRDNATSTTLAQVTQALDDWSKPSGSSLSGTIYEGYRVLVIGHSALTIDAIETARSNNTKVTVYCYCPGPGNPQGRETCEGCPFSDDNRVDQQGAIDLIQKRQVDCVLAAACAYHWTHKQAWVTRHGRAIAEKAPEAWLNFFPVGGNHKEFKGATSPDQFKKPSAYVDLLDESVLFGTSFLR